MEPQDQEKEYRLSVWEMYRSEWVLAGREKRLQLNQRMLRWQELMKNGWTASQAYIKVMQEESDYGVTQEHSERPPRHPSWSWMRQAPFIVLTVALAAAIVYGALITGDRNALKTELESVQSVLASMQAELSSTKQSLASTQAELSSTKQSLASTQAELSSTKQTLASTQADLASVRNEVYSLNDAITSVQNKLEAAVAKFNLYEETLGVDVFSGRQPQVIAVGRSVPTVELINNPNAKNPTWQQLMEFLLADPTDDETYRLYSFNCVDFAEMLHNNAEAAGIKSAFVAIQFYDEDVGHTLNAFKTMDRGLVYVDVTGSEKWLYEQSYTTEWDKIAYVVKGKEYAPISLGQNTPLHYDSYEKMKADWDSYDQKLEAYNKEVKEFNEEIFLKVYYIGTIEWRRIEEWERTLIVQKEVLDSMRAQLEYMWEPLGIVESIEIYW